MNALYTPEIITSTVLKKTIKTISIAIDMVASHITHGRELCYKDENFELLPLELDMNDYIENHYTYAMQCIFQIFETSLHQSKLYNDDVMKLLSSIH
jgi:hypothetical protein